jgi:hypothetical protein
MEGSSNIGQRAVQESVIAVTYRGAGAKVDAEILEAKLQASGVSVQPLTETGQEQARLGTPEIVLTILASAAVKAVATTALSYLQDYLRERVAEGKKDLNIQVVVKDPASQRRQRLLLSMKLATAQTVIAFGDSVKEAIRSL